MSDAVVVLSTFASAGDAERVGKELVEANLAACVNLLPEIRSIYRWEDKVTEGQECLAIIKTTAARFEALRARLIELHTYDVPEVIALPVVTGHEPYLAWVRTSTGG